MKTRLLPLALAAFAVALSVQISSAQVAEEKKESEFANVTVAELQAALKDGKVTVIDANGLKKYNVGHVPGALHFKTIKKSGLAGALPEDKSALIVTYCGGPQ